MADSKWNPDQYDRFRNERRQPFFDLLALVRRQPAMSVVDLGCGTGELTAVLHAELQAQETVGLDRSETMLAKAAAHALPGLRFGQADIGRFEAGKPLDLIFSNAALHWVDGHEELFERLAAALDGGGQLAVQMPANHDHPSHVVAHEVAGEEPFATLLGGYVRSVPVLPPQEYAALLDRLGFDEQHVRLQVYPHHLPGREDVIEWVKGTLLVDYQERLPAADFDAFLARYRQRLLPQLAATQPYFYPFKRILLWGRRG